MMSLVYWKAIGQPVLSMLPTLLTTFNDHSFRPHGIIPSFPMQLGEKVVCLEVEVVDAPINYNLLLGRSWTCAMHALVDTVFQVLLFPHEGLIVTIDHLSFSCPDPSSGASTVPMIDNPQPDTVNIGVGLCPSLMGTFDYPPPSGDVKFISAALDQPRAEIFQMSSFRATYFHDPWTLPSPSASMEGTWDSGMAIPLSTTKFAYNIVQQASVDPDPTPAQKLDPFLKTIWAQGSLATTDSLDLVYPSDEAILEALTGPDRPYDDLHHRSYFLLELRRIEAGKFVLIMSRDRSCPVNPLETHAIYAEGNMESIIETIPIDISRTPRLLPRRNSNLYGVFLGIPRCFCLVLRGNVRHRPKNC
jgi:hypothetical protein